MIKEVKRRIDFTEYIPIATGRKKDTESPPTIIVNTKYRIMLFNRKTLSKLGMDGKFIKFYYESTRKIIGWTVVSELSEAQLQGGRYKLVVAKKNGYRISIVGMLQQFKGLDKESYHCEVKKYVEQEGVLERGANYYFVQLTEDYDDSEK